MMRHEQIDNECECGKQIRRKKFFRVVILNTFFHFIQLTLIDLGVFANFQKFGLKILNH